MPGEMHLFSLKALKAKKGGCLRLLPFLHRITINFLSEKERISSGKTLNAMLTSEPK